MNAEFINLVKAGAIKAQMEYGVCASLTIAQAILESGWGQYAVGNNLFGIKWQDGCGYDKQLVPTTEYINGQGMSIEDWFRKYESWSESVYDHAQFLVANSRYSKLLGVKDYKIACRLIQEAGYATAPDYGNLLISIIEENKLYEFDKEQSEEDTMNTIEIPDASNIIPFLNGYIEMITEQNRIIFHKDKFNYISLIRNNDNSIALSVYGKDQVSKDVLWNAPVQIPVVNSSIFPMFGGYIEMLMNRVIFHRNKNEYISFTRNINDIETVFVDIYGSFQDGKRIVWK